MSESDTMFNERDRRCAAVQLTLSTDPSYDNRTIASTLKMQIRTVQFLGAQLNESDDPLEVVERKATSCHVTSSKSALKSTPNCTWMCWRVWWSPGAIRWPVTDPGCGSRTRHRRTSSKRPRLGFRRNATTLYPSFTAPLSGSEPAGLLRLVIRREHHQHDLPQHQSQPDRRHPPSIRRTPDDACGKGMLLVPDPYRGGDWGWRRLHWIDVSSTK